MTSPWSSSVPGRRSMTKGLWLWEELPRADSTDWMPCSKRRTFIQRSRDQAPEKWTNS